MIYTIQDVETETTLPDKNRCNCAWWNRIKLCSLCLALEIVYSHEQRPNHFSGASKVWEGRTCTSEACSLPEAINRVSGIQGALHIFLQRLMLYCLSFNILQADLLVDKYQVDSARVPDSFRVPLYQLLLSSTQSIKVDLIFCKLISVEIKDDWQMRMQ